MGNREPGGDVQGELAEIWPLLKLLNSALGNVETAIINFSMEKARDCRLVVRREIITPADTAAETSNSGKRRDDGIVFQCNLPSGFLRLAHHRHHPPGRTGYDTSAHRNIGVTGFLNRFWTA